jgi:hypothetical protein
MTKSIVFSFLSIEQTVGVRCALKVSRHRSQGSLSLLVWMLLVLPVWSPSVISNTHFPPASPYRLSHLILLHPLFHGHKIRQWIDKGSISHIFPWLPRNSDRPLLVKKQMDSRRHEQWRLVFNFGISEDLWAIYLRGYTYRLQIHWRFEPVYQSCWHFTRGKCNLQVSR